MRNLFTHKTVLPLAALQKKIIRAICFFLTFLITVSSIEASVIKFEKNIAWASFRDLSSTEFGKKFKKYKKDYILIDTDTYKVGSTIKYAMVWRKNTDNRKWAAFRNMSSKVYKKKWASFRDKGYRPTDIESYIVKGKQQYSGIWVKNKEGYGWTSKRDLTASEYGTFFQQQKSKGYRVVDIEVYQTRNGLRYAAIWVQNKENVAWAQNRDMSRKAYQEKVDKYSKQGYLLLDFEVYKVGRIEKYAAIWEKRSGYSNQIRTNRTSLEFANLWREYRDKGYRLIDFERYQTKSGDRYGGIWIENASRMKYRKKGQIDALIKKYRSDNNLPGISVAVVKDGKMIYRRGFGHANKEAKKVAHGESVYLAASISKVIGGTIAAKLQEKGQLNLNNTTLSYLTNVSQSNGSQVTLPASHKHTVAQLFAHLGCIQAYSGPEPSTQHYVKAIDALSQIWNAPFVSNCTTGSSYNYSTHGFTYLAAVLEKVTGKTSAQLVQSEIAVPQGLSSMRAMFASASVPANYERVKPYNNNNTPTSLSNNSWKIFGGGIETSPVDLAWFGWKVLDGKIVSKTTRDNVLWKRVNPSFVRGIGWRVPTIDGKKVAEHGGSFKGTQTFMRVYRDNGLVIAIMTNRKNQTTGSLKSLTTSIANTVL